MLNDEVSKLTTFQMKLATNNIKHFWDSSSKGARNFPQNRGARLQKTHSAKVLSLNNMAKKRLMRKLS